MNKEKLDNHQRQLLLNCLGDSIKDIEGSNVSKSIREHLCKDINSMILNIKNCDNVVIESTTFNEQFNQ